MQKLLMLHGFTGSHQSWEELRPELANRYELITPDIAGHGAYIPDDFAAYHIEAEASRIAAMLTEPAHVYGYSMGGRLALTLALNHPNKVLTLFLESATPGLKTEAERAERIQSDNALADKIEANGIEWFADYWGKLGLWANQTAQQKAALYQQRLKNNPRGLANSLRGMGTGQMPSLWDSLSMLSRNVSFTVLLTGEFDTKFMEINKEMSRKIPNSEWYTQTETGHAVHVEKPQAVIALIDEFLTDFYP